MSSPARTALGVARLGVATTALLAPSFAGRLFGLRPDPDPFLARLFGSRELALALGLLLVDGADVRRVALLGAAIDGTDVVSGTVDLLRGQLSTRGAVIGIGGAAVAAALGLLVADQEQRRR